MLLRWWAFYSSHITEEQLSSTELPSMALTACQNMWGTASLVVRNVLGPHQLLVTNNNLPSMPSMHT
jgi:hypothetical protein